MTEPLSHPNQASDTSNRTSIKEGLYLVLAAGFSRRFGSPKLLHNLPSGKTIIETTVNSLPAVTTPYNVVVRKDDVLLKAHLNSLGFPTIEVSNAAQGLGSVIAEAVQQVKGASWIGVCLGDMPFIDRSTYVELAHQAKSSIILRPTYQNQPGHPVIFGSQFFTDLEKIQGDDGAKSILKSVSINQPQAISLVDIHDPMILEDIDQLSDAERLINEVK